MNKRRRLSEDEYDDEVVVESEVEHDDDENDVQEADDRTWAIAAHLGGLFLGFVAPLVVWLMKRDDSPLVASHGKEALNFHLTTTAGIVVSAVLAQFYVGYVMLAVVIVFSAVFSARASIAADRGAKYRYPISVRVIR